MFLACPAPAGGNTYPRWSPGRPCCWLNEMFHGERVTDTAQLKSSSRFFRLRAARIQFLRQGALSS